MEAGGNSSHLPQRDMRSDALTPDGRWLVAGLGKDYELNLIDLDAPLAERIPVPLPDLPDGRKVLPVGYNSISPDGRWLPVTPRSAGAEKRDTTVYMFDFDRRTYQKVADVGPFGACGWFPDSRRVLFVGGPRLKILDRETGPVSDVSSLESSTWNVALGPDGRSIYPFGAADDRAVVLGVLDLVEKDDEWPGRPA